MAWRLTGRSIGRAFLSAALAVAAPMVIAMTAAPTAALAQGEVVSVEVFHEALSPYGNWVEHPRYGLVWYPTVVEDDWRPYTVGRWVNTEEHGWVWNSDEAFGWAVFHYGRWAFDEEFGWIWVPGEEWGPAWVDWRRGEGFIGWTPLPPEVRWVGDRWDYGGVDFVSVRWRPNWIFVRDVYFIDYNLRRHCLPPAHNITIIHRTTYVHEYRYHNRVWINRGISPLYIQGVIKRPVPLIKIVSVPSYKQHTLYKPGLKPSFTHINIYRPVVKIDPKKKPAHFMPLTKAPATKIPTPPLTQTPKKVVVPTQKTPSFADPRLKQLEQKNLQERRLIEQQQLRERFILNQQKRQTVINQQNEVKKELSRIQDQRRLQVQNKTLIEKSHPKPVTIQRQPTFAPNPNAKKVVPPQQPKLN
ncbi:MAG: hypothetical protein F9K44_02060 [Hyphomicrobiaceae bacterium]|nr:MAG: hypothetical protein F9K44_02060 [Hyphomicrobiaceae bacterium]